MEAAPAPTPTPTPTPHIVVVPSPGMGHLIPLLEFAKRLLFLSHNSLAVTFAIPSDQPPTAVHNSLLRSLPPQIRHLFLPQVSFHDLPPGSRRETIMTLTVTRSLPSLRHLLISMAPTADLVALVTDHFAVHALEVGKDLNLPSYIFFPSTAMALAANLYLPDLDQSAAGEYRHHPAPIRIPGCVPIHGRDLLEPTQNRQDQAYKLFVQNAKRFRIADGIFVNSFPELEPGPIRALLQPEIGKPKPPVYPIGPLVKSEGGGSEEIGAECLEWLDGHPKGSVLFVSFGSRGTLSSQQTVEFALGLEMSGQRFLWVVRRPNDIAPDATNPSVHAQNENDTSNFLPVGFVERVRGRGLVVPSWAPQAKILRHESTGGFLSHCGWNSTLESVMNGVPLIAWPLFAEQRMNAVMLTEEIGAALRPRMKEESGIVEKEEIARVVKELLEGEEGKKVSDKMKFLKVAAKRAVGEDGRSTIALSQAILKWTTTISG